VLVGTGTVKKDNPELTVRLSEGRNPKRIIIDTDLKLSRKLKLFSYNKDANLIILTSKKNLNKKRKIQNLLSQNVKVLFIKEDNNGKLNLKSVLKELGKNEIASLLVEGGSELFTSFVKKLLFDNIYLFVS